MARCSLRMLAMAFCLAPTAAGQSIMGEQVRLTADDAEASDQFGQSVDVCGDHAAIGAWRDARQRGSVYLVARYGRSWIRQAKLTPSDGHPGQYFGGAVALSADRLVVGAHCDNGAGFCRGAVYVFVRLGSGWLQEAKLEPSVPVNFDYFGGAVAISGETILVGAAHADDACGDPFDCNSGAVYVFVRIAGGWVEQARLLPSDTEQDLRFGASVAIQGDVAAIGGPSVYGDDNNGAVYVFERGGLNWVERAKLEASDADGGDGFGGSVALDGETILVGAKFDEHSGPDEGSAYVFRRTGNAWSQEQKLLPGDPYGHDVFGFAVGLQGDLAVVGDLFRAYAFARRGGSFVEEARLYASGGLAVNFGQVLAVDDGRVIGGARAEDVAGANAAGAAYIFDLRRRGVAYCAPGQTNSSGMPGEMRVFGSDLVDEDSLTLSTVNLPTEPNVGYFLMGTGSNVVTPPGSVGPVCVGPGIKRFFPAASTSEHPGGFTRRVGTRGPVSQNITAGSTWSFQAWHRDAAAGASNLTDAVSVNFQ